MSRIPNLIQVELNVGTNLFQLLTIKFREIYVSFFFFYKYHDNNAGICRKCHLLFIYCVFAKLTACLFLCVVQYSVFCVMFCPTLFVFFLLDHCIVWHSTERLLITSLVSQNIPSFAEDISFVVFLCKILSPLLMSCHTNLFRHKQMFMFKCYGV